MLNSSNFAEESKRHLESLSVKELREMAKVYNLVGRWKLLKSELIDALMVEIMNRVENPEPEPQAEQVEPEDADPEVKEERKGWIMSDSEVDFECKEKYINGSKVGSLVAFRTRDGKVMSAKIISRNEKAKKLTVESRLEKKYYLSYKDVLWVRTGKRWPTGVFELLTGGAKR